MLVAIYLLDHMRLQYDVYRLQEKEKASIMLEDEKKRATEQAKLLEMDLEVCTRNNTSWRLAICLLSFSIDSFEGERKNTPTSRS